MGRSRRVLKEETTFANVDLDLWSKVPLDSLVMSSDDQCGVICVDLPKK